MTAALAPPPATRRRTADALLDGAIAGVVGAIVLILWSVALDMAERRELPGIVWIPAIVIGRLARMFGGTLDPPEVVMWAGVLFLLLGCIAIGATVAWLLTRARRAPTVGMTLTASVAALLLAFFVLDGATGGGLFTRLRPWSVLTANALAAVAMTLTLRLRQPRLIEGRRDLWDDEP